MLFINCWFGRTGNNMLQIIRAIHYAKINNHKNIKFKYHKMLKSNDIILNDKKTNNIIIQDSFFYIKKLNINDPEPYLMKKYFQKYIKPIFKINFNRNNIFDDNKLFIHFRGGDIFSSNPHSAYVQPPLSYYTNIIKKYKNIKLICEDKKNPCINELIKLNNVEYTSNSLKEDLENFLDSTQLMIGFGTFGFLLYLINENLKILYIPKYFIDELPSGKWGNIEIISIELPNYIKIGEWKNTPVQRHIMLNYF